VRARLAATPGAGLAGERGVVHRDPARALRDVVLLVVAARTNATKLNF
jgi:hypothetical protein